MATKIKLMRLGKKRAPYYRIVVADARNKRDGKVIETIGKYHPKEEPSFIEVDADRASYWLGVGAQPTEPVERILKVTGDWQSFKGEAAPEPMKVREPRVDKRAAFEAASLGNPDGKGDATTPAKKRTPRAEDKSETTPSVAAARTSSEAPAGETPSTPAVDAPAPAEDATSPAAGAAETAAAQAPQAAVADSATATESQAAE